MPKHLVLSFNSAVSWTLKILMAAAAAYFLIEQNWMLAIFATGSLSISLIPAGINHSYDTNLPWGIDFWLTLWLTLSVAGEAGFYERYDWWDNVLHLGGTAVLVYLAFVLIFALNFTGKVKLSIPLIGFFTFMVGAAFGAIWEVLEFRIWRLTGLDTLATGGDPVRGFFDTFSDLQLDLLGAVAMSFFGMAYIARQRHVYLKEWIKPFAKLFGQKVRRVRVRARSQKVAVQRKIHAKKRALKRKLTHKINKLHK